MYAWMDVGIAVAITPTNQEGKRLMKTLNEPLVCHSKMASITLKGEGRFDLRGMQNNQGQ